MFGYLRPYKEELRLKDIKRYSAYYCALCNQIRMDYGILWTFFLNYESVYILLFLESVTDCSAENMTLKCHLNPFMKRKTKINRSILKYAAFVNMLLIKLKLEDDEYDEKRFGAQLLGNLLDRKKQYGILSVCYKELIANLREESNALRKLESEHGTLDSCADTTGNMLNAIINYWLQNYGENNFADHDFFRLHLYIGKYIYILDAYEDMESDMKKNQFNPILTMKSENHVPLMEKTENILFLLKKCIYREVKHIELKKDNILFENILTFGLENALHKAKEKKCTRNRR